MENRIIEPLQKRVCAFFDGQNLFHAVKEAFGYNYPNFDPVALAQDIAYTQGWQIPEVRFYKASMCASQLTSFEVPYEMSLMWLCFLVRIKIFQK